MVSGKENQHIIISANIVINEFQKGNSTITLNMAKKYKTESNAHRTHTPRSFQFSCDIENIPRSTKNGFNVYMRSFVDVTTMWSFKDLTQSNIEENVHKEDFAKVGNNTPIIFLR